MHSVEGNIIFQNDSTFVATFLIKERQHIYSGQFNTQHTCLIKDNGLKAILTYNVTDDLTGTQLFAGYVGRTFICTIGNTGPVQIGTAALPDDQKVDPECTVTGFGTWTSPGGSSSHHTLRRGTEVFLAICEALSEVVKLASDGEELASDIEQDPDS